MCSLPQGWHGLSSPRNSLTNSSTDFVSSVPKFRWNSSQMTQKQVNLPPRKSSLTALPNFQSKIPPARTTVSVKRSISVKSEIPALCKDHLTQLASLKKEILALKAENTVVKARVRKLDDENSQMSRQIVKLKVDAQKESMNQRTVKEEPLRQKIVKLESALKEKDFAIRKMVSEMNVLKIQELKDIFEKYKKEFGIKNGIGSGVLQRHKLPQAVQQILPSKPVRPAVTDQSLPQLEKLRTMLHKRESEIQILERNSKEKDTTIRQLKMQISQMDSLIRNQSSTKLTNSRSSASRRASDRSSSHPSEVEETKRPVRSFKSSSSVLTQSSSVPKISRTSVSSSSSFAYRRHSAPRQRFTRSQKDIEQQAQALRENIAARKIQQGWRHHRAMKNIEGRSDTDKAFYWIYSELNAHKQRKDKLKRIQPDSNGLFNMDEEQFAMDVQMEFLKLLENHSDPPPPLHPAFCA